MPSGLIIIGIYLALMFTAGILLVQIVLLLFFGQKRFFKSGL